MKRLMFLTLLAVAPSSGCTHTQLSHSALHQADTTTDLQYNQVLSNLALFHCNPDALPHFSVVGTGGASVTDQGMAALGAADAANEAGASQGRQQLVEIRLRDTLARGDRSALQRPFAVMVCELNQRTHPVIALHAYFHLLKWGKTPKPPLKLLPWRQQATVA